jgi:hypothetical protein
VWDLHVSPSAPSSCPHSAGEYPLGGLTCLPVGHHEGDWEHLTVRLQAPPGYGSMGASMQAAVQAHAPAAPAASQPGSPTQSSSVEKQAAQWRLQGVWYNSHRNCEVSFGGSG